MPIFSRIIDNALQWRRAQGELPYLISGVVLVREDGSIIGWKNALRDAQEEVPGTLAVDTASVIYVADFEHRPPTWRVHELV